MCQQRCQHIHASRCCDGKNIKAVLLVGLGDVGRCMFHGLVPHREIGSKGLLLPLLSLVIEYPITLDCGLGLFRVFALLLLPGRLGKSAKRFAANVGEGVMGSAACQGRFHLPMKEQ